MRRGSLAFVTLALIVGTAAALASIGGGYTLDPYTINSGGGVSVGGGYAVVGAIGQAPVGTQVGGAYMVDGGFFAGLPQDTPTPTATPTLTPTPTPIPGIDLLVGGDMEVTNPNRLLPRGTGWTRINPSGDRIVCNPNRAHTGNCAYRFRSSPNESSTLRYDVNLAGVTLLPGDRLELSAYVSARNTQGARLRIVIRYNDGRENTVARLPLEANGGVYERVELSVLVMSADIRFIRVFVQHTSRTGVMFIDDMRLFRPEPGLLPYREMPRTELPPGFRSP